MMMRRVLAFFLVAASLASFSAAFAQNERKGISLPKTKLLTSRLPRGVEGVTIDRSGVRLKPGYKAVKQPNGGMAVARIAGGTGGGADLTGTFMCICPGGDPGACWVINNGISLTCMTLNAYTCSMCTMIVVIQGAQTKLMSFETAASKPSDVRPADVSPDRSPATPRPFVPPRVPPGIHPVTTATPRPR